MKKKDDIELDLDLKFELENHEKEKKEEEKINSTDPDCTEKIVEGLMDDFNNKDKSEESEEKEDDPPGVLTYGQVSFFKDQETEPQIDDTEIADGEETYVKPKKPKNDLSKHYNVAILSIITILLLLAFFLVRNIVDKNGKEEASNPSTYETEENEAYLRIKELDAENKRLKDENSNLRNELASILTESGAEYFTSEAPVSEVSVATEEIPAGVPSEETLISAPPAPPTPEPTPEPTPDPTPQYEEPNAYTPPQELTRYTVQDGDTLSELSTKFYGTSKKYQKIVDANNLANGVIKSGQTIIIPE